MRTPSKHKKSAGVAPGFKKILASLPSVLFTKSRFGYKFETGWTFTGNVSQTTSIIIVQFCGRPPRGGVDEMDLGAAKRNGRYRSPPSRRRG